MANRVLRDWTFSENVDNLSAEAERMFVRLIMKADDFGLFHANTKLLKASLFPLKEISQNEIISALNELQLNKLIQLYTVGGKDYLKIFEFNQRLRAMNRKFPEPNDGESLTIDRKAPTIDKQEKEIVISNEIKTVKPKEKPKSEAIQRHISIVFPWETQNFINAWNEWKVYKSIELKFGYKTEISEGKALKELYNLATGSEEVAIKIINQSIAKGWKGFFALQNNFLANGNTNSNQNNGKPSASQQAEKLKSDFNSKIENAINNA